MTRVCAHGLLMLGILLGFQASVHAQVSVEAGIAPNRNIRELEAVQYYIRAIGATETPRVQLTGLENLKLVGGPGVTNRTQSINGQISRSVTLTWTLLPEKPGTARIPAFQVTVNGQQFETSPIEFEVTEATDTPSVGSGGGSNSSRGANEPEIFIQSSIGNSEVYVGQPFGHSMDIISGVALEAASVVSEPTFENFWVEEDRNNEQVQRQRIQRNGRIYNLYPYRNKILVPNRPGTFTIEPYILRLSYRDASDRMRFFSFGRERESVKRSSQHEVTVLPLPERGKPEDFDGAVGQFTLTAELDRNEAEVDQAVGLKVSVRGNGFLKSVKAPIIEETPGLKVFPPQAKESSRVQGGRLRSSKTWEWILVPLQGGELQLKDLRFSFFNPETKQYETVSTSFEPIQVSGTSSRSSNARSGVLRELRRDVEFVKQRGGELRLDAERWHKKRSFYLAIGIPILLASILIVVGRMRKKAFADPKQAKKRRAYREAKRRLAAAEKNISSQDVGSFHEGISRALVEFVAAHTYVEAAGLSYDRMDQLLAEREVQLELRERLRKLLEVCDFARYVPSSGDAVPRAEHLKEARSIVDALQKVLE